MVELVGGFILARMKLAAMIACAAIPIGAQQVVSLPVGTPRPDAANYRPVPADASVVNQDPNLHANVLTLIQLTRDRARLQTVDDFLNVTASVYEKHFTGDEIQQLIAMFKAKQEGKPVKAPEILQQTLTAEMPAILSEITGGTTQVAVKLGSQIGGEIAKEHPEYLIQKPAAKSRITPS